MFGTGFFCPRDRELPSPSKNGLMATAAFLTSLPLQPLLDFHVVFKEMHMIFNTDNLKSLTLGNTLHSPIHPSMPLSVLYCMYSLKKKFPEHVLGAWPYESKGSFHHCRVQKSLGAEKKEASSPYNRDIFILEDESMGTGRQSWQASWT